MDSATGTWFACFCCGLFRCRWFEANCERCNGGQCQRCKF